MVYKQIAQFGERKASKLEGLVNIIIKHVDIIRFLFYIFLTKIIYYLLKLVSGYKLYIQPLVIVDMEPWPTSAFVDVSFSIHVSL